MIKVFVYGSLLSGLGNHRVLGDSVMIEETTMQIAANMVSLVAFPALVHGSEINDIKGEVYAVDEQTFSALDRLEGHPHFYQRMLVDDIWVYFLNSEHDHERYLPVADGDWRTFHEVATEKRRKYG